MYYEINEVFLSANITITFITLLIPELQDGKVAIFEKAALDTIKKHGYFVIIHKRKIF